MGAPPPPSLARSSAAVADVSKGHDEYHRGNQGYVELEPLPELRPALAEEVAQGDEARRPEESPAVGEQGEDGQSKPPGPGHRGGQVPDAGHVVAEGEGPTAQVVKPVLNQLHSLVRDVEVPAVPSDQIQAKSTSHRVTEGDSAEAAENGGGEAGEEPELPA